MRGKKVERERDRESRIGDKMEVRGETKGPFFIFKGNIAGEDEGILHSLLHVRVPCPMVQYQALHLSEGEGEMG